MLIQYQAHKKKNKIKYTISSRKKEKYNLGNYDLIQYKILSTNIIQIVLQTVRRYTRNNKDYHGIDIQYPNNKGKNIHIVYQTSLSLFYSRLNFKLKKKTTTPKTTSAVTYFH